MNNLQFIGKNAILNSLNTGNTMVDMAIGMILCSVLTTFIGLVSPTKFYVFVKSLLNKCKSAYKLKYSSIQHVVKQSNPSIMFKGILHHINNSDNKNITNLQLFKYPNKLVAGTQIEEYIYTIKNCGDIEIHDDIFVSLSEEVIECSSNTTTVLVGNIESTSKKEVIFNIILTSKKHTPSYIKNFMDKCEQQYRDYLIELSVKNDIFVELRYRRELGDFKSWQYPFSSSKTLDGVFFKQKDELIQKFNFFLNNKDWYKRTGKPYTFGVMLYGPPGCGKTSFIKAILGYTKRCGVQIDLTDDIDLTCLQHTIMSSKIGTLIVPPDRRILIFEDVDCMGNIVKCRELKKDEKNKISEITHKIMENNTCEKIHSGINTVDMKNNDNNNLSKLLNIFDGPIETSGRICIFTTNQIEYLDKALIRPGRVDCLIRFTKCDKQMLVNAMNHFYESDEITLDHVKKYVDESISPAEVDSICFKNKDKWKALEDILYISSNIEIGDNVNIYSVCTGNKSDKKSDKKSSRKKDKKSGKKIDKKNNDISKVATDEYSTGSDKSSYSSDDSSHDSGIDLINDAINTAVKFSRQSHN